MISPDDADSWDQVAAALRDGLVSGMADEDLETFETHGSVVVVGGALAYKLKKPVDVGFFDYSARPTRKNMCQREVELNQRLARDVYLGVSGIRRSDGAPFELCDMDDVRAIEHVVVMRRIDPQDMLHDRVNSQRVSHEDLRDIGQRLATFHAGAPPAPLQAGSSEDVRARIAALTREIRQPANHALDRARLDAACDFLETWFATNEDVIAARHEQGFVRDGHGDLRLEHVVMSDPVQFLDCVEFDDALRHNDVLADLSFLVMELEFAARGDLARVLVETWGERAGPINDALLWAFSSWRALIRVEVGLARLAQLEPGLRRRVAEQQTQALLNLSTTLGWRARSPTAIIFAGLAGSGKTTLSRTLAERWGLERISSDAVRKQLVGVGGNDSAPAHAYEDRVSRLVYERLGTVSGREVAGGRSIVIDATFRRAPGCPVVRQGISLRRSRRLTRDARVHRAAGGAAPPRR